MLAQKDGILARRLFAIGVRSFDAIEDGVYVDRASDFGPLPIIRQRRFKGRL